MLSLATIMVSCQPQREYKAYEYKPYEQVQAILDKHKTELLDIPGVRDVIILRHRGRFVLHLFTDRGVAQKRIPQSVEGVPVISTVSIYSPPGSIDRSYEQAKAIRKKRWKELLDIPGVQDLIILVRRGGGFAFRLIVNETADQEKIPKSIEGIPVRFTVQASAPPRPMDRTQEVVAVLQRHEAEILDIPGVQTVRLGPVDFGRVPVNGERYRFYVTIDKTTDQRKVPKMIEGIPVEVFPMPDPHRSNDATYESIKAIQARHEAELFRNPGVYSVGIGMENGKWIIGVGTKEEDLQYIPKAIEGIKVIGHVDGEQVIGPPGSRTQSLTLADADFLAHCAVVSGNTWGLLRLPLGSE